MSYNLDRWQTIQLENLTLLFGGFSETEDLVWGKENALRIRLGEGEGIKGLVTGELLSVQSINIYGTGSSRDLEKLKVALAGSTGRLDALLIWEGGDSITRLTSIDGKVTDENVDVVALIRQLEALLKDRAHLVDVCLHAGIIVGFPDYFFTPEQQRLANRIQGIPNDPLPPGTSVEYIKGNSE